MLRFSAVEDLGLRPDNDDEQAKVAWIKYSLLDAGVTEIKQSTGYNIDAGMVAALNSYLGTTFAEPREVVAALDTIRVAIEVKKRPPKQSFLDVWIAPIVGGVAVAVVTGWLVSKYRGR